MPHEPGRTVTIPAARLRPWIDGFEQRHGPARATSGGDRVQLLSPDGAEARIAVPFPPLPWPPSPDVEASGQELLQTLATHVQRERRVAALLVRKGGFAVGVFEGSRLVVSKVGSAYVQGRTKAGGWSQQRYARRRDNQSRKAYDEAADEAARVLLPHVKTLDAVATGGDRPAVAAVLADQRLGGLRPLVLAEVYPVVDPRLRVLQAFPEQFLTVRIDLNSLA
jgi:hypothetical protein